MKIPPKIEKSHEKVLKPPKAIPDPDNGRFFSLSFSFSLYIAIFQNLQYMSVECICIIAIIMILQITIILHCLYYCNYSRNCIFLIMFIFSGNRFEKERKKRKKKKKRAFFERRQKAEGCRIGSYFRLKVKNMCKTSVLHAFNIRRKPLQAPPPPGNARKRLVLPNLNFFYFLFFCPMRMSACPMRVRMHIRVMRGISCFLLFRFPERLSVAIFGVFFRFYGIFCLFWYNYISVSLSVEI